VSLEKIIDIKHIERLAYVNPDDLAPSLGLVVRSIVEGIPSEEEEYYHRPSIFFALTYPTQNFLKIVESVVQTFVNGGAKGIFLNLDMGSGKTHLLTLLLHLFATCNLVPDQCTDIQDYKRVGYDTKLAEKTVVFAFDLRTPKTVYSHQLKLTKIILERMGLKEAAEIIERSIAEERMPDPHRLAEAIPRDINILILIDELYYGAAFTSDPEERRIVKDVIEFVRKLLDYRRGIPRKASGIVAVVATARRDEQLWQKLRTNSMLEQSFVAAIENFVNQLDRILGVQETRWLSIEDAKRILEKRLCLPLNNFNKYYHSTFNKFIEKIIRVDTDVPQAHHMRSLIKAMAIFTLNAIKARDSIVTPAHFDESIITTLLPSAENLTQVYRSIYGEISNLIQGNRVLQLAVNAIFALTITGDPQKLIDIVKIAKTGGQVVGSELRGIPLIEEKELIDILKVHGVSERDIAKTVDDLAKLHTHIHSVQVPGRGYAFFVAPVVSIVTLYTKTIEDRYRDYLSKPNTIVEYLVTGLLGLKNVEQDIEVEIIDSVEDVQKKPHSKDKLYVYILADKHALLRMAKEPSKADEVLKEIEKAVEEFLLSRPNFNIVFILPQINIDVIHGIARYLAIDDATRYVKEHYIDPLNRKPFEELSELDRTLKELINLELEDFMSEVNKRIGEATAAYTSAIKISLTRAVYRTPDGVVKQPFTLYVESKKRPYTKDLGKAIDILQSTLQEISADLRNYIVSNVKELRYMIFLVKGSMMYGYALDTMLKDVDNELKKNGKYEIRVDDYLVLRAGPDRFLYIPPSTMRSIVNDIVAKLEQQYKGMLNITTLKDKIVIELKQVSLEGSLKEGEAPKSEVEEKTGVVTSTISISKQYEAIRYRDITEAIDELLQKGGGYIVLKVRVDKDSIDTVRRYVSILKRYIADWRAEPAAG